MAHFGGRESSTSPPAATQSSKVFTGSIAESVTTTIGDGVLTSVVLVSSPEKRDKLIPINTNSTTSATKPHNFGRVLSLDMRSPLFSCPIEQSGLYQAHHSRELFSVLDFRGSLLTMRSRDASKAPCITSVYLDSPTNFGCCPYSHRNVQ